MKRRHFLTLPLAARAAIDYRDYSRILPDYLRGLAQEAYERRNRALAALASAQDARRRMAWARATFWELVGGPLERTPLNAKVTASLDRPRYRIEKVIFESRPELHIPANLYVPKGGSPPYPGVLFQMGHALNGKANAGYQYCCQGLAQLGFVVLAFDPMGQGERTYYPREGGNLTRLPSADDEHTVPGKQLILTGDTSTRLQTWDAVRALDYLASLPFVDPARLASTGNSGGGTLTMFLAAVDDRLACAAPACPNTENLACANFNPPGSTDDAEQNFLGAAPKGFDRWDTLYPMAPKPLLILVSAKDAQGTYSPRYLENGREEFAKLRRVYELLGAPGNLEWFETPLPHGLSYDVRMAVYRFFRRHLQRVEEPLAEEPAVRAEPDEVLYVSPTGNVVRDLKGATPFRLARARLGEKPAGPAMINRLLGLGPLEPQGATRTVLGRTESRQAIIEACEFRSAPDVWIPAWLFRPREPARESRPIVLVAPAGRNAHWQEGSLCQQLAARGLFVAAIDVRGVGDLAPEYPRHAARHASWHQSEEAYAWASLMLGKPLVGQRVADILAVVRSLGLAPKVTLAATGKMTVPALFAAAMERMVEVCYLHSHLASYELLLEEEEYDYPFANFLFDVARRPLLPTLAAMADPRRVVIASPRDGRNRRLEAGRAREFYRMARNVTVLDQGGWDTATLQSL